MNKSLIKQTNKKTLLQNFGYYCSKQPYVPFLPVYLSIYLPGMIFLNKPLICPSLMHQKFYFIMLNIKKLINPEFRNRMSVYLYLSVCTDFDNRWTDMVLKIKPPVGPGKVHYYFLGSMGKGYPSPSNENASRKIKLGV